MMLPLPFPASTISLPYGAVDGVFYTTTAPHQGTDFSSRSQGVVAGTIIPASGAGVVVRSGYGPEGVTPNITRPNALAGNSIDVDYGDCVARYMHRPDDSPSPAVGARVGEGLALGVIGATGLVDAAHLHMETWDKATGRRVNPAFFFDFSRVVTAGASASIKSITFDPQEDDMYDAQAERALFAKIEAETRPFKTYQLGSGLILIGDGGAVYTIPSQAYQDLLIAQGLTSATVQRVLDPNELAFIQGLRGKLSPDPRDVQVQAILQLTEEDAKRIAAHLPAPVLTVTQAQLDAIATAVAGKTGDAVKAALEGLSFVVKTS